MGLTIGSEMATRRKSANAATRRMQLMLEMTRYLASGLCIVSSPGLNAAVREALEGEDVKGRVQAALKQWLKPRFSILP